MVGLTLGTLGHFSSFYYFFLGLVLEASLCECSIDRTELISLKTRILLFLYYEKMMIDETKSQALMRVNGTFLMSVFI